MFILVALAFAILIYRIYLYLKLFVSHLFIRKIKKKNKLLIIEQFYLKNNKQQHKKKRNSFIQILILILMLDNLIKK